MEYLCIQARIKCRRIIEDRINHPNTERAKNINESLIWVKHSFKLDPDTERMLSDEFDFLVKPEEAKAEALEEKQASLSSRIP